MENKKKIVEVTNLEKNYGSFKALKGVSFSVYEGEIFGFIGPNGAGKSTTIRTLLGLLKKDGGSAKIFGYEVFENTNKINSRISYVPSDVYLWPNLTGGEIIDYLLKLKGVKDCKAKERLIKLFSLDPTKKASTYSKGNRQKVAVIAALAFDADLYIFDEPTSGLDPLNERLFQQELKALKAKGKSIILSSHILSEVEKLADTVAIIRNGKIIEYGDILSLRKLSTSNIRLFFKDEMNINLEPIKKITDKIDSLSPLIYQFSIEDCHVKEVLEIVKGLDIEHIEINRPNLEELFMHYYGDEVYEA